MSDAQAGHGGDPRRKASRPRPPSRADTPTHPPLIAALLMIGVVVFLILISVMSVR